MKKIIIWSFIIVSPLSCKENKDSNSPLPIEHFSGVASFNANLSADEPFANYEAEYKAIFNEGAKGAQTAAPWASLNPVGTTYDFASIANPYFGLSALTGFGYGTIFLNIPIITIDKRSMPSDIASSSFDDPSVKSRFRALIDAIKDQLNDNVKYIALGNEVDTYFASHPSEWIAYQNLIEDARSYLKSIKPNVLVGVTTTFEGASSTFTNEVNQLNSSMDVIILTYYPIDGKTFVPRDPTTVTGDIAKMKGISLGKQIIMQEWGYPSSSFLGSSEKKQAEFMYNSLVELEKQGASTFPFVSFFKFRDWNTSHVQVITGQTANQPFYEFMSTLGMKKNDGNNKEAFTTVAKWLKP